MERALPSAEVKAHIATLAIGLAADCDAPEDGLDDLMHANLAGASTLPFAGFITPDGTWVEGFSGFKDGAALAAVLAAVEKSPLLDATPAVRKQLDKLAKNATAAAQRSDWRTVLGIVREAGKCSGRCPERDAVKAAEKKAREWAAAQLDAVVQEARSGGDLAPCRKKLVDVKSHFAGEPEGVEADSGTKAVGRLTNIREAEKQPNAARDLRDKAAAAFQGTRWAAIFKKPGAAPPDKGQP